METWKAERIAWGVGILVLLFVTPAQGEPSENFVVPGADFSQLMLERGVWCRYIVVDEALDQEDSTEVYVGVPAREDTPRGSAYWVELATTPLGSADVESQVFKLLVLEGITGFSEGDSLGDYVLKLYIKKGVRPAKEEDPRGYRDLSMIVPTADSDWESLDGVAVRTAGGRFVCTRKARTLEEEREIPTGSVKLIRKSRDDYTVWFSSDVPVFRLVKCVIERSRETDVVPRVAGIPVSGKRHSRTTAELTGYGFDAKPILSLDGPNR